MASTTGATFNPKASSIARAATSIQDFVDNQVKEELKDVPHIGDANKALLVAAGVGNVTQLVGVFLTMRQTGLSMKDWADSFALWLGEKGIKNPHRNVIVTAIARKVGEKLLPGTFDFVAVKAEYGAASDE